METTSNGYGPHRCVVGNGNWPIASSVAAIHLGAARRAIDEGYDLALTTCPAPEMVRLADMASVQRALVLSEGAWISAMSGVTRELERMWDEVCRGGELSKEQRLRLFAANAHADRESVRIVNEVCQVTGPASIMPASPLARMRKDAQSLHGHLATNGAALEHAGKVAHGILDAHTRV